MKTLLYSLVFALALAAPAFSQTKLAGKWEGRLQLSPDKTMAIEFVFTEAAGKYSAVLTSPDDGAIKNVAAKSVTFANDKLTVDVPALAGGYTGTLRNGVFEGEWSQEGAKLPLSLKPYSVPALTPADIETLRGDWSGPFKALGLEVTIVLRFSSDAKGALRAVMDIPEQGVKDLPASNVSLKDGHFRFDQAQVQARIEGQLKGDQMTGHWNQFGNVVPLTLKRGKFVARPAVLDLSPAARDQIKGRWKSNLNGLTVVVKFETDAQGRMVGHFDSVDQKVVLPISAASLTGQKFTFGLAGIGGKFTGDLAGDQLTGEWTQMGLQKPLPMVLTREK